MATTVPGADEEEWDLGDRATMVITTVSVSRLYNGFIFSLLGVIDRLLEYEVKRREEDLRVWGPWAGEREGSSVRLLVTRADNVLFSYSLQVAAVSPAQVTDDTDWTPLMEGVFERGESLREGDGEFGFDASVWRIIDPRFDDASGQLFVGHARSGDRVFIDAVTSSLTLGEGKGGSSAYTFRGAEAEGGRARDDRRRVPQRAAEETYIIRSRWNASLTGRADFAVTGGEFGEAVVHGSECWDALDRSYFVIDPPGTQFGQEEGSPDTCVFSSSSQAPMRRRSSLPVADLGIQLRLPSSASVLAQGGADLCLGVPTLVLGGLEQQGATGRGHVLVEGHEGQKAVVAW